MACSSGVFKEAELPGIAGTDLQRIWQDYLLALSIVPDDEREWIWVGFALVYSAGNLSYAQAAARCSRLLIDATTFRATTIEELLDADVLEPAHAATSRDRYVW